MIGNQDPGADSGGQETKTLFTKTTETPTMGENTKTKTSHKGGKTGEQDDLLNYLKL